MAAEHRVTLMWVHLSFTLSFGLLKREMVKYSKIRG